MVFTVRRHLYSLSNIIGNTVFIEKNKKYIYYYVHHIQTLGKLNCILNVCISILHLIDCKIGIIPASVMKIKEFKQRFLIWMVTEQQVTEAGWKQAFVSIFMNIYFDQNTVRTQRLLNNLSESGPEYLFLMHY